jgi:integrase
MNRIRKQMNLYGATAHTLRHTYLTMLEGTGIDLKTLQYVAGHAHVQTTMNIYVHTQEENISKAGELLDRLIDNYTLMK